MVMGTMTPIGEIYRGLRAKSWLAAAMTVEFLGLAGAISAIPSLAARLRIDQLAVSVSWDCPAATIRAGCG